MLSDPYQIAEVVHGGAGGVVGLRDPRVLALVGHNDLWNRNCSLKGGFYMCFHLELASCPSQPADIRTAKARLATHGTFSEKSHPLSCWDTQKPFIRSTKFESTPWEVLGTIALIFI